MNKRLAKEKEELKAGSEYEQYLVTEFKNIKKPLPTKQEEIVNFEDPERLQSNIARGILKDITTGPGLINEIIKYLSDNDELTMFDKYGSIFKKAVNRKLKNLDEFMKEWQLFLSQNIGSQLIGKVTTNIYTDMDNTRYKKTQLEKMTTEKIDSLFRQYVTRVQNKPIDDIEGIKYTTSGGAQSGTHRILNKEGIIQFGKNTRVLKGSTPEKTYNEVKIRYIYQYLYPESPSLKDLSWTGPKITTESSTVTSPTTEGSGLLNTRYIKKNSVYTIYR